MDRHNREGVSMIKKELEKVYTDFTHHGNLEEFFKRRSSDGSNALKKGNIETPSSSIFTDLGTVSYISIWNNTDYTSFGIIQLHFVR